MVCTMEGVKCFTKWAVSWMPLWRWFNIIIYPSLWWPLDFCPTLASFSGEQSMWEHFRVTKNNRWPWEGEFLTMVLKGSSTSGRDQYLHDPTQTEKLCVWIKLRAWHVCWKPCGYVHPSWCGTDSQGFRWSKAALDEAQPALPEESQNTGGR